MKDVNMYRGSVLFTAVAITVAGMAIMSQAIFAEDTPAETAKTVAKAADKALDVAKDNKAVSDKITNDVVATTVAPATENIRISMATITEAALTKGGFGSFSNGFVDADRMRLATFKSPDAFAALDSRVDSFQKNWKAKYGVDFSFVKNANEILGDSFAHISQGEIGQKLNAEGKTIPSDEPKMVAGIAEDLKKSGVNMTNADSAKYGGGDTNKDMGRNIATIILPATHGMPVLALPMIHELPNSWQIDLPDSIDGQQLHDHLLKHLAMVDDDRANWPADATDAYRLVARHVLTAVMETDKTTLQIAK